MIRASAACGVLPANRAFFASASRNALQNKGIRNNLD